MTAHSSRVALITGCSSGIGKATAKRMHRAGLVVYATARKPDQLLDLADGGIRTLELDVTDETSMKAAVDQIVQEQGGIDVLVNNAGVKVLGPIEETPEAQMRWQFDVNFFGLARLTQLVLPGMRERRSGRIINISSVYGRFSVPGGALPAAANHALTAFNDALRLELENFGIRVVLIEPAATRGTRLHLNAFETDTGADSAYGDFTDQVVRWHAEAIGGTPPYNIAGKFSITTEDVARAVTRAATAKRPPSRYPVGFLARSLFVLRRFLPTWGYDLFIHTSFPVPKAPGAKR